MDERELKRLNNLRNIYSVSSSSIPFVKDMRWLLKQFTMLEKANESLTFQLQDRIKLEHDHNSYISIAKEKTQWVMKCASLSRKVWELEEKLKGK